MVSEVFQPLPIGIPRTPHSSHGLNLNKQTNKQVNI